VFSLTYFLSIIGSYAQISRHFSISFLHNDVDSRLREQINIRSKFIPNGDGIVTPS
jgi:hypothetical protein